VSRTSDALLLIPDAVLDGLVVKRALSLLHSRPKGKGGKARGIAGSACPPPCNDVDPYKVGPDGMTLTSRVGVAGDAVPPPPGIGRLPNLNEKERAAEDAFIKEFEKNPDKMASEFRDIVTSTTPAGEPKVFGTDDAKVLTDAWQGDDIGLRSQNRATLNAPLHQTANAVAKRAFVQELDELNKGDGIMVTVGGVGAGKGYALKNVPEAQAAKSKSKVVWDSAGDQNATENPWIQAEAAKRGLNVTYVYVHADPKVSWADPGRGVVKRAGNPKDGRMVDAHVFGDSYAVGAKNHAVFAKKHENNSSANFVYLDSSSGPPKKVSAMPKEALSHNAKDLTKFATDTIKKSNAPKHVKQGGTIGGRLWGE